MMVVLLSQYLQTRNKRFPSSAELQTSNSAFWAAPFFPLSSRVQLTALKSWFRLLAAWVFADVAGEEAARKDE